MASNDDNKGDEEIEIWSGGLKWALKEGYRKSEHLETVRQELVLWLENLDELIDALGPKAEVGEVLEMAADDEEGGDYDPDEDDQED
jgi:hypothetical protein